MKLFFMLIGLIATAQTCRADPSTAAFSQLLNTYQSTYAAHPEQAWQVSDQISSALFANTEVAIYTEELQEVQARTANPAFVILAKNLQDAWEARYFMSFTADQRNRNTIAGQDSLAFLLLSFGLGKFEPTKGIAIYFTLFRKVFPSLVYSGTFVARKYLGDPKAFDRNIPPSPAQLMTSIGSDEPDNIDTAEIEKELASTTLQIAGYQIVFSAVKSMELGSAIFSETTFDPFPYIAGLIVGQTLEYSADAVANELELKKLENNIIADGEAVIASVANDDAQSAHDDALKLSDAVLALATFSDTPEIDAANKYQRDMKSLNDKVHIPILEVKTPQEASAKYKKKLSEAEANRDKSAVSEVDLSNVATLMEQAPEEISSLPTSEQNLAYWISHETSAQQQLINQQARLSAAFKSGQFKKDAQYTVLETIDFLESLNSPYVEGTITDLARILASQFVLQN